MDFSFLFFFLPLSTCNELSLSYEEIGPKLHIEIKICHLKKGGGAQVQRRQGIGECIQEGIEGRKCLYALKLGHGIQKKKLFTLSE